MGASRVDKPELELAAERWAESLGGTLEHPVRIAFGRSRSVPIQVRKDTPPSGLVVRLHTSLADAPSEVRIATASWIRSGRRASRACRVLDEFIAERLASLPPPQRKTRTLRPRGECHDLTELTQELLSTQFSADFGDGPLPDVTWGRRQKSSSRRSLRLGSYEPETHLVRLHPVLDQPGVPRWFVRYVLFHELLHAALPPKPGANGRWIHHSPAFRRRERTYPDYEQALRWEDANLPRMIRSARLSRPMRVRPSKGVLGTIQGLLFPE